MKLYRNVLTRMLNKEIDVDTDSLFWTLHTSTYVPNFDTHQNVSDLTNELATGGGYTSGGLAATGVAKTYTVANSWGVSRVNSTAYNVGDIVRPAVGNGFLYRCVVAGTSAGTTTTLGTVVGNTTVDGSVTWENVGSGITTVTMTSPAWPSATFGPCRYAVLSDRQTGTAATEPLIGLIDFGIDKSGQNGTFQINLVPNQGVITIIEQ